ncbi:MAG: ABC transporter substrate-binding protein, partial [Proteobacteria bacterium]|nr:ABC transporter substrate-binding protein [Pseudomonadota bacterium]
MGLGASALFAPPAAAANKPVVVLVNSEPVNLDPQYSSADSNIMLSIHEGLFRLDNEGRIVPAVAESIKAIDSLTWEIKIRPGLTFHNGEPINADAVVFTFDRAKKLFAAGKGDLNFALGALRYERMEKVDDLT